MIFLWLNQNLNIGHQPTYYKPSPQILALELIWKLEKKKALMNLYDTIISWMDAVRSKYRIKTLPTPTKFLKNDKFISTLKISENKINIF